jgi:putative ABC transport system substrate-binding protein
MTGLGYIEGKNLIVDARAAEGRYDRLPGFAQEIVDLHPDAIVAEATPAIAAAQRATKTIPIVMAPVTDPIGSGFIESFARPGRNITGVANMFGDLTAKSLEILHRVLPNAKTVAVLMSANPTHAKLYDVASNGARMIGLSTLPFVAATPADLERTFTEIKQARCDALYTLADPYRPKIPELAAATQIPAIYQYGYFVEFGGGLMATARTHLRWSLMQQTTSIEYSREQTLRLCPLSNQPNSNSRSILRLQKRLVLRYPIPSC